MKYSSETKTHGSIRTMKSGGAAGVVLGLAAVGLAMGTTQVRADEKVVDANQPKVQETGVEVKESTIKNETPTGNASTNLNAPAGAISDKQKADLSNENKVTGETPVSIDHTKVQEEAKNAEQVGVNVVQDKTQVAPTTSTAEDTAKAVKSITAKETEKSNELKSTATAHSTAVSNWVDQKNSTVAFNNELDKAHLKAVESYNDFIKTLDADTASVVAQHKDAIIKVTEIIQKASDGTSVEGYQAYIRSLAEQQGINKEAIKDYLVKKAEYNSKSTANSETVVRNLSNSTRIDAENKAKSQSVDAENTRRSTSAQKVVEENSAKSNSTVAENNRLSTSAKTENERRSNSAKEVENDNNAKSLSVKAENEKRSNSAKAENERRSNSAEEVKADNLAKSNSVVAENIRLSNSAKAENERRSNSAKDVENDNVAKSNSVVAENIRRSNSAKDENTRLSNSAKDVENDNVAKSNSVIKENERRSLSAKAENEKRSNAVKNVENNNVAKSNSVVEENKKRSQSADAETAKRSQSADAETAKRSNSAKAENEKRSNAAKQGITNERERSLAVDAENARRSNSAKAETDRRSNSAKAENEKRSNAAKQGITNERERSLAVDAENARRSNSAKAETDRRSNSAKAENEKRSLAVKKVEDSNRTKSLSVVAENNKRSNAAKAETARRSQSAAAETAKRSNSAKAENEKKTRNYNNIENAATRVDKDADAKIKALRDIGTNVIVKTEEISTEADAKNIETRNNKAYNDARAAQEAWKRKYDELKSKTRTEGYAKDVVMQALSLAKSNPNASVKSSKSGSWVKTNYVSSSSGNSGYARVLNSEWAYKYSNVRTGWSTELDYTGLQGLSVTTEDGQTHPITRIHRKFTVKDEGKTGAVDVYAIEDPTEGFVVARNEGTGSSSDVMEFDVIDSYFYTVNGKEVKFTASAKTPAVLTFSSLNYNNVGWEGAGVYGGRHIEINGSTVKNHSDGYLYADSKNDNIGYNWDVSGSPYEYKGAALGVFESGSEFKTAFAQWDGPAASGGNSFWFALNTKVVTPVINVSTTVTITKVRFSKKFKWPVTYKPVTFENAPYTPVTFKPETPPKYVPVTYQPANYDKILYTPGKPIPYEPVSYKPATYDKLTYTPGKPIPYEPVNYKPATYEKATYEPVTYTPDTPPKYEPVSYEKVTYTPVNTDWTPVTYEKVTFTPRNSEWMPVGYEKIPFTPRNTEWQPVGYEKENFTPADTSWKPVGYTPLKFKPKNTDWNPVPYVPTPYVPEKLPEVPKEPLLELAKLTAPTDPVFHKIPKEPKVPTVHYHLTALNENTPVEKLAQNEDGVNINNESVAKNSTNHFILKPKALPAGRPITTSIVLSDYMADGIELDISGMQKANKSWDISYNTKTRLLEVKGVSTEYDKANADRTVPYTPTAFTIIYKVLNDGATYENVFKMDINGGAKGGNPTGYTSYSNKVRIHTPGSPTNPNDPRNPNGGGNHKIQPVKNNTNKEGQNINNKTLLQTDVNYYVAEWDLDQYINDKSSKSAIAKGFGYLENYPEKAVTPVTKDYYAVTSKGEKVEGLDFYEADSAKLNELPEFVQQFIKDSGIDVSNFGKFQVWIAKDSQAFYNKYVKTGQDIFFHLPMAVNKGFTGKYENQTFQIDFGNGYYGNVVRNNVPNLTPKKDVVVDGKSANGGTITYGQEFSYLLSGAKLPGNRGSHVWEYRYIDDYDQTGDKYLGKYKVVATTDITVSQLEEVKENTTFKEDVTLEDGTVIKAGQKVAKGSKVRRTHVIKTGEDVTKFTESVHDEAKGIITISFKEDFLKSVVDSSEFGADASIDMKRIAYGEFYNKYANRVNGVDYISNTVKTTTPKPPTPEQPAPKQPQLPYTGTIESSASLVGMAILSVLGLVGLYRRRNQ